MGERVRIGQAANPAEATLLRSLFDAHGVAVAINGEQHAAMLGGLGGGFISLDITVDAADAERARDLLAEFQAAAPQATDEDEDDDGDDVALRLERRKRIGIALMLSVFITFGTAHLSAGAYKRALAIALAEIWLIREMVVHPGDKLYVALFVATLLFDLIDAIRIINQTFARRLPVATVRRA
jgi:hypothetical protein